MRSRLICSLVSAALFVTASASAEMTRVRVSVDELPRQDALIQLDAKNTVLPNGVKEGSTVPKSWHELGPRDPQAENGHCTDDRKASVGTIYSGSTSTMKIWEANGKTWLDNAEIETTGGIVHVKHAERAPLARIADGIWAYRRKEEIVIVAARDIGFMDRGPFYECRVEESTLDAHAGTAILDSSPHAANNARLQLEEWASEDGKHVKHGPSWVGVEFRVMASVSKTSADPAAMLNLVIKRP